jgi:hypothetical protein
LLAPASRGISGRLIRPDTCQQQQKWCCSMVGSSSECGLVSRPYLTAQSMQTPLNSTVPSMQLCQRSLAEGHQLLHMLPPTSTHG